MAGLRGKSALDAVNLLTTDIYSQGDKLLPTYCVLLDVKSCYPTVQHDILVRRLRDYFCIDGAILGLIADLLKNTWTQTVVNQSGSKWLVSRRGLSETAPPLSIFQ